MNRTQKNARKRLGRMYLDYVTIPGATFRDIADKYGVCHQRAHFVINRVDEQLDEFFGTGTYRNWRDDLNKRQVAALRRIINQWVERG